MVEEIKTISIRTLDGNVVDYIQNVTAGPLGQGRVGTVYKVTKKDDKSGQEYALKQCQPQYLDLFDQNARKIAQQKDLEHFVAVTHVGTSPDPGKNGQKANFLVMEYGGSNLLDVYKQLKSVKENVSLAFKYKVLYTLAAALQQAHAKGISHGDIHPKNIVCGFELREEDPDLEAKLIQGQIKLCDQITTEKMGTHYNNIDSVFSDDARLLMHFSDIGGGTSAGKDQDKYAFFKMMSWLLEGNAQLSVAKIAKRRMELDISIDSNTQDMVYPSWEKIKEKLEERIVDGNYYNIGILSCSKEKKYPAVLRPVDNFRLLWAQKTITDLDELKKLFSLETTPTPSSYQRFLIQGGARNSSAEKGEMTQLLGEIAVRSAAQVAREIEQMCQEKATLSEKYQRFTRELNEYEEQLKNLKESYISSKALLEKCYQQFMSDHTTTNNTKIKDIADTVVKTHQALVKDQKDLDQIIATTRQKALNVETQIQGLQPEPLKDALGYLRNKIYPALPDACKTELSKHDKLIIPLNLPRARAAPRLDDEDI